jgi:hypothetical protein
MGVTGQDSAPAIGRMQAIIEFLYTPIVLIQGQQVSCADYMNIGSNSALFFAKNFTNPASDRLVDMVYYSVYWSNSVGGSQVNQGYNGLFVGR